MSRVVENLKSKWTKKKKKNHNEVFWVQTLDFKELKDFCRKPIPSQIILPNEKWEHKIDFAYGNWQQHNWGTYIISLAAPTSSLSFEMALSPSLRLHSLPLWKKGSWGFRFRNRNFLGLAFVFFIKLFVYLFVFHIMGFWGLQELIK